MQLFKISTGFVSVPCFIAIMAMRLSVSYKLFMQGKVCLKSTNCLPWVYARSKFSKIFTSFFGNHHLNDKHLKTISYMQEQVPNYSTMAHGNSYIY